MANLSAQEANPEYSGNHELKLNAAYLLAGVIEGTYERILGEESAIGVSAGFALDDSVDYRFGAIPYYRLYFGKKRAAGFFVEGNAAFYSARSYDYYDFDSEMFRSNTEFGGGLGLAVGGKFITRKGWIAEIFLGAGRNFFNTNQLDVVYPRAGVLIGKRF